MFTKINGLEMNIEKSNNHESIIYFNKGIFKGENVLMNVEPMSYAIKCSDEFGFINFYFNPNTYKLSVLMNENIQTPHRTYGYHLGGVTKRNKDNGSCVYKFLLPTNNGVEFKQAYNDSYNASYNKIKE